MIWRNPEKTVSGSGSDQKFNQEFTQKINATLDGKFNHLVADVRTMVTHMGDTSNLILDPDLDSYYLMDVTLLALPQTQDRLARATQYGYEALRRGGPTEEEKIQRDETDLICQELDANCDAMRQAVAQLETQVKGHNAHSRSREAGSDSKTEWPWPLASTSAC
jgi:hypothetical protein